jgi:hypothetical protein
MRARFPIASRSDAVTVAVGLGPRGGPLSPLHGPTPTASLIPAQGNALRHRTSDDLRNLALALNLSLIHTPIHGGAAQAEGTGNRFKRFPFAVPRSYTPMNGVYVFSALGAGGSKAPLTGRLESLPYEGAALDRYDATLSPLDGQLRGPQRFLHSDFGLRASFGPSVPRPSDFRLGRAASFIHLSIHPFPPSNSLTYCSYASTTLALV